MTERALRWWSQKALAEASTRLEPAWRRWCAGWAVEPANVVAENANEAVPALSHAATVPGGRHCGVGAASLGVWLSGSEGSLAAAVATLVFGRADAAMPSGVGAGSIAAEAAATAQRDLLAELRGSLPGEQHPALRSADDRVDDPDGAGEPPASDLRPWSGAIVVTFSAGSAPALRLRLHVGAAAAEQLLAPAAVAPEPRRTLPPLTAAGEATASLPVTLQVGLNDFALDLGTLQSLRTGDVLTLAHSLDSPLLLNPSPRSRALAAWPQPLCQVLLGARGNRRAVELIGIGVA